MAAPKIGTPDIKTGAQTHIKRPLWEIPLPWSKTQRKVKMGPAEDGGEKA